jgi:hypothetical protein
LLLGKAEKLGVDARDEVHRQFVHNGLLHLPCLQVVLLD